MKKEVVVEKSFRDLCEDNYFKSLKEKWSKDKCLEELKKLVPNLRKRNVKFDGRYYQFNFTFKKQNFNCEIDTKNGSLLIEEE